MLICLGLACAACSSGPEDVVSDYYKAVSKGDIDKAVSYFASSGVNKDEKAAFDAKLKMIIGELKKEIDAKGGLDSVDILKTTEDGKDSMHVEYKLKFKNGTEKIDTLPLVKEDGGWKIPLK